MAKKRKYPKAPKQKAALDVWKRYEAKCSEVKKHNDALDKIVAEKKRIRQAIRNKVSGFKASKY